MNKSKDEPIELNFHRRASESVVLSIPVDTLDSIRKIAQDRDMSMESLLKFYIGQGLRQDIAKAFSERLLDRTAAVLSRHFDSKEEVSSILQEIKMETLAH